MLRPNQITACLVTRGDVDLQPILDSLIFDRVVIWNNADRSADWMIAGRYLAMLEAPTRYAYVQDDDVIVPRATQRALFDQADGLDVVANWAHGEDPDGYDDIPLVGAGAIIDSLAAWRGILRYAEVWPLDDSFKYEADFVVGTLYRDWKHLHLPFEIRDIARNGNRLADEPWQKDLKLEMTNRGRAIRDGELVAV